MECCNICFCPYSNEPCKNILNNHTCHKLECNHDICYSCYIKLQVSKCPFCRNNFNYTQKEVELRKKNGISYTKWQPPVEISDYIPEYFNDDDILNDDNILNEGINEVPFSRINRNRKRNRRRDLTFDEVLHRRQMIKTRCKRKWLKKNGRKNKEMF